MWVRRCRMRREPGEATGLLAPRRQEAAKCNVVSGLRAAGRRRKNRERAGRGGSNSSGSWLCLLPPQACPPLAKATIVRPGGGFPMQPPSVASGFRNRDDEARSSSPSYYLNPIISLPPSLSLLSPSLSPLSQSSLPLIITPSPSTSHDPTWPTLRLRATIAQHQCGIPCSQPLFAPLKPDLASASSPPCATRLLATECVTVDKVHGQYKYSASACVCNACV